MTLTPPKGALPYKPIRNRLTSHRAKRGPRCQPEAVPTVPTQSGAQPILHRACRRETPAAASIHRGRSCTDLFGLCVKPLCNQKTLILSTLTLYSTQRHRGYDIYICKSNRSSKYIWPLAGHSNTYNAYTVYTSYIYKKRIAKHCVLCIFP